MLFNLFGRRKLLNEMERKLLGAVTSNLSQSAAKLLSAQLGQINLVQRICAGQEVNLYSRRKGKTVFEEATLFPLKAEAKLATIKFTCGNSDRTVTADIWAVEGHVFSIEFDQSPPKCTVDEIRIVSNVLHVDPVDVR